jgi:peroxiredoxin
LGADVLALAVTPLFSQMAFSEHIDAPFRLLSDFNQDVCRAYGVRYAEWKGHKGVAKRSLFVVDAEMIVRFAWSDDDAEVLPDLDPVINALRGLGR